MSSVVTDPRQETDLDLYAREDARLETAHSPASAKAATIGARRWANFRANTRAYASLWIFIGVFGLSLLSDVLCNDRPLIVSVGGKLHFPFLFFYPETAFGGDAVSADQLFRTEADFKDRYLVDLIEQRGGWILWPPVRFGNNTMDIYMQDYAPSPPSTKHWFGTDDVGRDVLAKVMHGFRLSIVFGLGLTVCSSLIGIVIGATQGYFGGWIDLTVQRFVEMWAGMPILFMLIIMASLVEPSPRWMFGLLLLFSWMALVGVTRAEFLRARNFEYVRAARALGVGNVTIMRKHVLPNAMTAAMTMVPFILTNSVVLLTSLDFLGFGLPPDAPSLGRLIKSATQNLHAPWLALTAFFSIATMLTLLIFIGEGVRDAFNPCKAAATVVV